MAERTERTETRFIQQFSDSEIFDCRNGKSSLTLGVSAALSSATPLPEMPHERRARVLGIEISPAPHSGGKGIARFWALVSFEAQDQRLLGQLNNGTTLTLERFGPTPHWPFQSQADSQRFFTLRVDNGPVYQCKAVYQPDR